MILTGPLGRTSNLGLIVLSSTNKVYFDICFTLRSTSRHDEEISAKYRPKYPPAVFHTGLDISRPETQQFGIALDR